MSLTESKKITNAQVNYAERKALQLFESWNNISGHFEKNSSSYSEIVKCILDSVHCGILIAIGNKIKIEDNEIVKGNYNELH